LEAGSLHGAAGARFNLRIQNLNYFKVQWIDAPPDEAIWWFHEVRPDGFEVRKAVQFSDGHWERAEAKSHTDYCRLSESAIPSLADINAQGPFDGHEIDRDEFERMWELAGT
jgi:hypothetical protein